MKIAILGNSGSGKSTLAKHLAEQHNLAMLDLDTVYWKQDQPGVEEDAAIAVTALERFFAQHSDWVIEGCYESLIEASFAQNPEFLFLDPGLDQCQSNCRSRPWEAHKYPSKQAQDAQLPALLEWVADYYVREGTMSHREHVMLFEAYTGSKRRITELQ